MGQQRDRRTLGQPVGSEGWNSSKLEKSVGFLGFPGSISGQNVMEMVKKWKEASQGREGLGEKP